MSSFQDLGKPKVPRMPHELQDRKREHALLKVVVQDITKKM